MIGAKLSNRYEILRELGRGGMGVVYLAQDPVLDREVAVKVVTPEHVSSESVERFKREARVVAKMDHPAIVSVYDSGEHEGRLFFVMPFVDGTNLRALLREQSLRLGELIDVAIQVAEALDYSHSLGVVHRDIKPENIMVTLRDAGRLRVRVTDFGLAMAPAQGRLTKTAAIVGTVAYMSPEQVMGAEVDASSDIYSFGTVLYECLVGHTPFSGEVHALLYRISHEIPMPPQSLQMEVDEEVEELLMRCLEKDPAQRPTIKEIADTLSRYRLELAQSGRNIGMLPTVSAQLERPAVQRPFVARDKEFAELQRRLNAALSGECQLALVAGQPAIGKSRLLEELEKLAKARMITVLHGRFGEIESALPYQGYCEIIQEYFRARPRLQTPIDFSDLARDLIALFPVLAEVKELGAGSGESARAAADGARRFEDRSTILELLARCITRMAAGKPLVLFLEDLHAADASVDALDYIVRRLGPTPTLIVGTYRTTEVDRRHRVSKLLNAFKEDRRFVFIQLGPLSPSEHRMLLEQLMGGSKLEDSIAKKFYEATEGNPYFTNELVHSLIDSGGLVENETGEYRLSSETALSIEVPATIRQTVEERIERLPEELREILSVASVLGRSFEFPHLQMMAEQPNLEGSLEELIRSGFLEEDRQSRTGRFSFSSGVVRDALYASLPRLRRRLLHKKYAEELEKRNQGRPESVTASLFEHYSQADIPEKVIKYGLLLVNKSLHAFSPEDAIRTLHTVLDFLEYQEAGDPLVKGEAQELLAAAYRMTGNAGAAMKALEGAIGIFEKQKQTGRLLQPVLSAAELAWQALKVEEARRWLERGIDLARAVGQGPALIKLLSLGATVANLRGEYEKALEYLAEVERLRPVKGQAQQKANQGGTISVALANPCLARHPANAETMEETEVLANAFEPLITADAQGNLIPHLCERWETLNEGAVFSFMLRKEVRFHDGRKLTAKDVKDSFEQGIRRSAQAMIPGFAAISGISQYLKHSAEGVSGIVTLSDDVVQIRLDEPLPLYPALLMDLRTAIAGPAPDRAAIPAGTGPFKIASLEPNSIVLERNANYWNGPPPLLDSIHFTAGIGASEIAQGFRSGKFDLIGDVLPQDLDEILRDPQLRATFVETALKNVYFVLFNQTSSTCGIRALRQALSGVIPVQDLVPRTLGRFAQPAHGLLPPGILGHDPGRRSLPLSREKAIELLQSSGLARAQARATDPEGRALPTILLNAAVYPILQDRYASFIQSLFKIWSEIGVEVSIKTSTLSQFADAWWRGKEIDLIIGRWIADYDDPDAFTYALFHSEIGELQNHYSSPKMDQLMLAARTERQPETREKLYRKIENQLLESRIFFPLFHEIDYRVANPKIAGLALSSIPPYVNYSTLARTQAIEPALPAKADRGILKVGLVSELRTLDPSLSYIVSQAETLPAIFETLTRAAEGAQMIPWLASAFAAEEKGKRFRFHLRDGVRFHDGRRLTARDVRFSFERLLQNPESPSRWLLSSIRGANKLLNGESKELEGFQLVSALEFVLDLEKPVSFFPAILADPTASILPEGTELLPGSWREGCVGTGPFRVVAFEPPRFLKLEANPDYWRQGYPKCEGLEFHYGLTPSETVSAFKSGRLSVARNLSPSDAQALLREPEFAEKFKETASLHTAFVALNVHKEPFSEEPIRHRFFRAVDVEGLTRRHLGRFAVPARTITPPSLLGYEPGDRMDLSRPQGKPTQTAIELTASVSSILMVPYSSFIEELLQCLKEKGFDVRIVEQKAEQTVLVEDRAFDLVVAAWAADYPDADTFFSGLLHSKVGWRGRICGIPALDVLIERAGNETDSGIRHSIYRQAEEMVRKRALLLPLFHLQNYWFARPEVEGLELNYFWPTLSLEKLRFRQ